MIVDTDFKVNLTEQTRITWNYFRTKYLFASYVNSDPGWGPFSHWGIFGRNVSRRQDWDAGNCPIFSFLLIWQTIASKGLYKWKGH